MIRYYYIISIYNIYIYYKITTVFPQINAAVFIKFRRFRMRRLKEGGVLSRKYGI